MRKKYLSAALAATLLSAASAMQAQPIEGGGSYEPLAAAQQSSSKCTGTVTDDDGEPLPGATVRVDGTTNATSTNSDCVFSLNNVKA